MKMIYIANIRIPTEKAHGFQIMKMAESFSGNLEALELIVPRRINKEFEKNNPFDYYQVKEIFKIKKLFCFDPVFLLKFGAGFYIKFQATLFAISLFLYLLLKSDKKDYFFYTRDEYLLPILQVFSKKVIWECHALPAKANFYQKYFKNCLRLAVLTAALKDKLESLGIEKEKILVSPDAVEIETFDIAMDREEARRALKLPADKKLVGYTGSFKTKNMDKGLGVTFQALKILAKENPDIIFVAVGGSLADIEYYKKIAAQIGVLDNVLLLGRVSQKLLAIYQKAFDVLIMPFPWTEHYAYYMSPLKMFEYMAAKKPIIASDLPAIREILNNNNAIIIKPDSSDDLANGIKLALQDKALCDKISLQAFQDVKNYSWQKRAENIIIFLK